MSTPIYDAFARVYDLQHGSFADDLPLYLHFARMMPAGGRILELGCGTGRVMKQLLRAGHAVTGVDESPRMLAIARERLGPDAQLVLGDIRALALDGEFALILIALNTFLHNLTLEDQLATLRGARRHLAPGGKLIIDIPPNDELAFQPDDGEYRVECTLIDPAAGVRLTKSVASRVYWASQEQALTYQIVEERDGAREEHTVRFRLRHVFKHELTLLLTASGFQPPEFYGDYQLHPYADDSPRMIAVSAGSPHRRLT